MKRLTTIIVMLYAVLCASAQDSIQSFKFGFISYEQAMKAMPDYAMSQQAIADLKAQLEAEQQRVEQEFNMKYEEFLDGQRDFPETILRKRQSELKELLERNIAFKSESRQQLADAEAEAMATLRAKLDYAVARISLDRNFAFVLNIDQNAAPFINPAMGEDITGLVIKALQSNATVRSVLR